MSCCSMTGYGQAVIVMPNGQLSVEIKSVNHRFADIQIRMPREWIALESDVRNVLLQDVKRGRVDVFISNVAGEFTAANVTVNWNLFQQLSQVEQVALERFGASTAVTSDRVSRWLSYPGVLRTEVSGEDLSLVKETLSATVHGACMELVAARRREGSRLADDLLEKAGHLRDLVLHLETVSTRLVPAVRSRLRARMVEIAGEVDEQRLLIEVAMLADRLAVDEELVRLKSHTGEFEATLGGAGPHGRRLDFIVQELHREINTLGVKVQDGELARLVVDGKTLIEQMREQVQNLE